MSVEFSAIELFFYNVMLYAMGAYSALKMNEKEGEASK